MAPVEVEREHALDAAGRDVAGARSGRNTTWARRRDRQDGASGPAWIRLDITLPSPKMANHRIMPTTFG